MERKVLLARRMFSSAAGAASRAAGAPAKPVG